MSSSIGDKTEGKRRKAEGSDSESAAHDSPLAIQSSQFPADVAGRGAISCPFCHATQVELFSLFGSQLLTSEYYCQNCRTVFEQVKR